ncbi:type IV inositol polyphosphate 5-phosphatase 9-like [Rutidosis leptorrhynchoides]|uniref:type IV inositol polyphosphate 5-phosphatase 9-like n=1 Tax=Rutidosis leptorrhynchoides TaxID=125765 RepID=UPI003A9987CE
MRKEVMWPRLVASKILNKSVSDNVVADFPTSPESFHQFQTSDTEEGGPVILHEIDTAKTFKIFVSTWNVGGVTPTDNLNIDDLLDTDNTRCDIYVVGFQEVVTLKASNVVGLEKKKISSKWNSLIRKTLNKQSRSEVSNLKTGNSKLQQEFVCVVSKRMVGLLLSVWAKSDVHQQIRNPDISSVGCGIMGCLGNKGSVSARFELQDTSFCFVCSHLASGGGEGDEQNRNSDAVNIFSRTSFPTTNGSSIHLPKRILDHDRVVLFGDLNYRISLPDKETRSLVNQKDWKTLVKHDQLRVELKDGQFGSWHEGDIDFAPTYKYLPNSDEYFCKNDDAKRSPSWCDRVIWRGEGLKQILYERSESKLSDHRPVKAIFSTQVKASESGYRKFYYSNGLGRIPTGLGFTSDEEYSTSDKLSFKFRHKIISLSYSCVWMDGYGPLSDLMGVAN